MYFCIASTILFPPHFRIASTGQNADQVVVIFLTPQNFVPNFPPAYTFASCKGNPVRRGNDVDLVGIAKPSQPASLFWWLVASAKSEETEKGEKGGALAFPPGKYVDWLSLSLPPSELCMEVRSLVSSAYAVVVGAGIIASVLASFLV